jgi:hypothetical protein
MAGWVNTLAYPCRLSGADCQTAAILYFTRYAKEYVLGERSKSAISSLIIVPKTKPPSTIPYTVFCVQVLYEEVFSIGFLHPSIECAFTAEVIKQIAAHFEEINHVKTGEPAEE